MNKTTKVLLMYSLFSFFIWIIPFSLKILFSELFQLDQTSFNGGIETKVISSITDKLYNGHKWSAFYLIFYNNLKVCLINVLGGVFLGVGTFINLFVNGLYTADVLTTVNNNGTSWILIFNNTIKHSFEMIGIWLSGGLGFLFTKSLFNLMFKNEYPSRKFYEISIKTFLLIFIIIFMAAYIECFMSIK